MKVYRIVTSQSMEDMYDMSVYHLQTIRNLITNIYQTGEIFFQQPPNFFIDSLNDVNTFNSTINYLTQVGQYTQSIVQQADETSRELDGISGALGLNVRNYGEFIRQNLSSMMKLEIQEQAVVYEIDSILQGILDQKAQAITQNQLQMPNQDAQETYLQDEAIANPGIYSS